jgi:SAM-dependent methyltransferase
MDFSKIKYEFNPNLFYSGYILRKKLLLAISRYSTYMHGKMMDFGCGSKPYKSLFNVKEYIGVDYEGQGHSHANEQIDVLYDGITLPFPDNYFDSIFSTEVFEHIFNLEDILVEIKRVMKPGARILVTCPFAIPEHEQPNDFGRYTSFGIKHLFEKNNFKILEYEKIGNHFEALVQLRISFYSMVLFPKLNKLVIVKPILESLVYLLFNTYAIIFSKIFTNKKTFYLNNIIVCEKL